MSFKSTVIAAALCLLSFAAGQLPDSTDYPIGPLTSTADKWAVKECDVTKYGAVADLKTDLGPPLLAAFNACKNGGVVQIPVGHYAMSTWVTLSGGSAWAINLEGVIYRIGGASSGHMIIISDSTDFELYSSRSSGAIQGYGYEYLVSNTYGPRLIRLIDVTNFAIHDIALVDSPAYHLILDTCTSGEVYNLIIHGGYLGGLDGIDAWGFNIHIHDVEVSNKDECVTIKESIPSSETVPSNTQQNPSNHFLIENIHCNWSGGCAIGSLGADTDIYKIQYRNIYTVGSNQMMMLKSNGGSGSVSDSVFENFIGHNNAYSLDINAYWAELAPVAGDGVLYTGLTFENWSGDCAAGKTHWPINVICPDTQPCDGLVIEDVAIWTLMQNKEYYKCENAWGDGACLKGGSAHTSFAISTITVTAAPSCAAAAYMPNDLSTGFATSKSIPIPTIPTTFFPGATPATKRAYP